jgi:hypothetical protein
MQSCVSSGEVWYGTWECGSPRIGIDGIDDCQFVGSPDQFQRDRLHFVGAETVELSKSTPQNTAWLKGEKRVKSWIQLHYRSLTVC